MLKLKPRSSVDRWKKTVDELTLADLREYWEFHNRTEGKSEKTVKWYNEVLGKLERFLEGEGRSTLIRDVDEPEVRAFIHYLQNKVKWRRTADRATSKAEKLSSEGIQNRVRALKAFFNWLHQEGYTEEHRLAKLKNFKVQRKVIAVLNDEEIRKILAVCDPRTAMGARDYAIVTLMLDSGLRFNEVVTLKVKDLEIESGRLKVLGKGNKERMVPFGVASQKALWRYANHWRPFSSGECFFLTDTGEEFSEDGFKAVFQRLAKRSGVYRLHAHLCRHTFATRYLLNGGDIFSLQQILGHTSLEMVRRYVTLASSQVVVQHRKFSPMDQVIVGRKKSA